MVVVMFELVKLDIDVIYAFTFLSNQFVPFERERERERERDERESQRERERDV